LIIRNIKAEDDIPQNVAGLILINSYNYPDTLAHVSVRARN